MSIRLLKIKVLRTVTHLRHIMEGSTSDEYTEVYRRLPWKLQLSYGVGHVLNDVCASMWFTYLMLYFQYVLEFTSWQAGLLMFVGQVADAMATPFVGFHSDQSGSAQWCRYGKRKSWHLFGTLCVLGAFPFIFAPCPGDCSTTSNWTVFYYSVFIVIFQFGWASVQISHLSLIPELTPNEHDRTKLTAIRYCFTVISNVLVYLITWLVLHLNNGESSKIGPGDGPKFQHVVVSVLTIGTLSSAIFHVLVKEAETDSVRNVRAGQLRTSIYELFCTIEVYQVAVIYMCSRLFVNLTQIYIPLYLHKTLDMPAGTLALVPLTVFVGSFLTSLVIEKINRHSGRKLTYILGTILGILACLWIQLETDQTYKDYFVYLVALLIGAGGSIVLVTSLGVTTDLIGDRTNNGAFVYGIMSFTDKLANGVAVIVIQGVTNASEEYYRDILTYICGSAILVGCMAVLSLVRGWNQRFSGYEPIPDSNTIN